MPSAAATELLQRVVSTAMRTACNTDLADIVELLRRTRHEHPETTVAALSHVGHFLVLDRVGGGLAAAVHVRVDGSRGRVGMLTLAPDLRRSGIAERMVGVAEAVCTALGCTEVDRTG